MLGDLNLILDGLTELEDKGIETIDCRRAQFSAQEPIIRLRMICQSWKVMFQAEYSSGSPLRMLVDLRASVEHALGRGKATGAEAKGSTESPAKSAPTAARPAAAAKPATSAGVATKPAAPVKPAAASAPAKPSAAVAKPTPVVAKAAAAGATAAAQPPAAKSAAAKPPAAKSAAGPGSVAKSAAKPTAPKADAPEFEVSGAPAWDPDAAPQPKKK
jgi:hypothetical protein